MRRCEMDEPWRWEGGRTRCRDKLQVVRYRGMVDECVGDHRVCCVTSDEQCKYES
jgi:hypothetical protein